MRCASFFAKSLTAWMKSVPELGSTVKHPLFHLVTLALSIGLLGACTTTNPPRPQAQANPEPRGVTITPAGFRLPEGTGCSADVARFRAIMKNDIETGHTTKAVFDQIEAEMRTADAMCAAGNAGGASAHVRATRARFGYPS